MPPDHKRCRQTQFCSSNPFQHVHGKRENYHRSLTTHQNLLEAPLMASQRIRRSPVEGLIVGSLSGLVGTILMTQFLILWKTAAQEFHPPKPKSEAKQSEKEKEDSTMKAAEKVGEAAGHKLSRAEKKKAGNWIHYGFGAAMGGIYGLIRETAPK